MDASTTDHLISLVPSPSMTVSPCPGLVQPEEHSSNTELLELQTQRVSLNRPNTTEIYDGESFITAPEFLPRHSTNSAIQSNRTNLVQNGLLENYKKRDECLAIFQDIKYVLCKQLHQLQRTLFEAVSCPHTPIPHLQASASIYA